MTKKNFKIKVQIFKVALNFAKKVVLNDFIQVLNIKNILIYFTSIVVNAIETDLKVNQVVVFIMNQKMIRENAMIAQRQRVAN